MKHGNHVKLSRADRKGIMHGELSKLVLGTKRPNIEAGDTQVVALTRAGRQFLARSEEERRELAEEGKPLIVDVPRQPTVWIAFREPQMKDGKWEVPFVIHDEREPVRMLAGGVPTGIRSEPGLKTRQRKPSPKGTQTESWTEEAERGYGGGGKSAVDEREAVDDATLCDYSRRIAEENALLKARKPAEADKKREKRKTEEELRRGNGSGARAAERRAERAERRLQAAA